MPAKRYLWEADQFCAVDEPFEVAELGEYVAAEDHERLRDGFIREIQRLRVKGESNKARCHFENADRLQAILDPAGGS